MLEIAMWILNLCISIVLITLGLSSVVLCWMFIYGEVQDYIKRKKRGY